jgi:hypothetical protein
MKHIKPYKIFESTSPNFPTTRDGVIQVCKRYGIEDYTINDDLSIDVDGDVYFIQKGLKYLPLKFNYVSGDFNCYSNNLVSLEGSPQTVGGDLSCSYNSLETLKGSPQSVGGYFDCYNNKLKTLKGGPQTVDGDFGCHRNKLKTLEGSPQTVGRNFFCYDNELKTLEGCPQTVGGDFDCYNNKLKDLEHFPEVGGDIYVDGNMVYNLVYTFIYKADSFMIEDFNDYEIVRNGNTVMLDRLQTFIRDNNLEMPDLEEIKEHYKIIE